MSALTPERLAEIEARAEAANDDVGLQYSIPAGEWLLTADKPTMQLMRHARTDVTDLLTEVDRLRAGIEYLRGAVRLGARTNAEPEAVHVLQMIHDDLVELLNPTEGETDDR